MANQEHLIDPNDPALAKLQFVNQPTASASGAAQPPAVSDRYQSGVISSLGLATDTAESQLPGALPTYRLMPTSPSGNPQQGAASQSTLLKNPTFVKNVSQTTTNTTNITSNTDAITALQATSFQGAWSSTTTYSQGASVDYSGAIYVSLVNSNLNNIPSSSPTDWVAAGGTANYAGVWSGATAYTIGQTVSVSTSLYIALQNSTNQNPASTTGYWQLLSGSTTFTGAWSNSTAYSVGAEVSYNGSFWIATTANTNQTPAPGSSYWVNVGTSAILLANYNAGTAYSIGMEVVGTDGNVYSAIAATTGNAPPNASFWQLVGPSSLTAVPDGTQRFAATASTLTYRPTSNPLTATDAGSNATVSIASFTMRTSSKGDISINSGSVTALSYSTLYYVYYDDATLAGGAVTYAATTAKTTAINGSGRFFVGSIVTPAATAPNTTGNGDGGVGAQSGQTSVFLFGNTTVTTSGAAASTSNPNNAIDGDLTTFATAQIDNTNASSASAVITLKGASPTSAPWTSLTLYALWSVPTNTVNPGATPAAVTYGGAGGGTLDSVGPATTKGITLVSVSLPLNQNLALMSVSLTCFRNNTFGQLVTAHLYEAWIVGIQ